MDTKPSVLTPANPDLNRKILQELKKLAAPGRLQVRLEELNRIKPVKRIFVMGCGRSGTWLLTGIISTFADVAVIAREQAVEHFGIFDTAKSTIVLKRTAYSYEALENIPELISIAYIVRHPFDVLTSHNPTTRARFHIAPARWLGEMLALQYLIDTARPHTKILRYEDVVTNAAAAQASLGESFGLKAARPAEEFTTTFRPPEEAIAAMHGVRGIDARSVGRWKKDPSNIDYLRSIRPRLGRTLDWVAQQFDYDITL